MLCLHNVSSQAQKVQIKMNDLGLARGDWYDLLAAETRLTDLDDLEIELAPYQVCWLKYAPVS